MAATEYVILECPSPSIDTWEVIDRVSAGSAEQAIRSHLSAKKFEGEGEFVAVPARSWQPRSVTVEVKRQLRLTGAGE